MTDGNHQRCKYESENFNNDITGLWIGINSVVHRQVKLITGDLSKALGGIRLLFITIYGSSQLFWWYGSCLLICYYQGTASWFNWLEPKRWFSSIQMIQDTSIRKPIVERRAFSTVRHQILQLVLRKCHHVVRILTCLGLISRLGRPIK